MNSSLQHASNNRYIGKFCNNNTPANAVSIMDESMGMGVDLNDTKRIVTQHEEV